MIFELLFRKCNEKFNEMKSSQQRNNAIKTITRAIKSNFLKIRSFGFLIFPCSSPIFDVYDILIPQTPLRKIPSVGCWARIWTDE